MSLQLINIGSKPADGSGDPIRVSFNKINENFTELFTGISDITANLASSDSPVSSVCGKTGQVQLTVSDILGSVTQGYVDNKINLTLGNIVGTAPDVLNTINELATAINNDPNFYASLTNKLSLSGGVLTGQLTLAFDPVSPLQPTTKRYVDDLVSPLTSTVANIYTKVEIDQLLLNITNDYGFVNDTNWGLLNQPVTAIEDNGSII